MNWVLELKEYRDFLQWNDEYPDSDYDKMTQDEAKKALQNDLEFIIGTNGYGELFERELEYMKLLGVEEE